jgi:hypothetical protein
VILNASTNCPSWWLDNSEPSCDQESCPVADRGTIVLAGLWVPRRAEAYSAFAHEANIDAVWDTTIKALLQARFPQATPDDLLRARACAYGGCVIQDLGYYPFGSHFFSNLLHYVAPATCRRVDP